MSKVYYSFLVVFIASILEVKAQEAKAISSPLVTERSNGQTFTFFCKKVEDNNILGVFGHFATDTFKESDEFWTSTFFRAYQTNGTLQFKIVLVNPNGNTLSSNLYNLSPNIATHRHTQVWDKSHLEVKGTYKFQVYLNDVLQEQITFEVKD